MDEEQDSRSQAGRFGFVVHPTNVAWALQVDASLKLFSMEELEVLLGRMAAVSDPFELSTVRIKSSSGQQAVGTFVAVPMSASKSRGCSCIIRFLVDLYCQRTQHPLLCVKVWHL